MCVWLPPLPAAILCVNIQASWSSYQYSFGLLTLALFLPNNHVHWYCRICDTSAVQIITLVAKISKKHDQLDMQFQEHEGKIDTLNEKMSSWEDEIDDLKSTLSTHESDIKSIKHKQETKLTDMVADIRSHEEKMKALESNRMINWPTSTESETATGSSMENCGTGTRIVNEVTRSVNERMERQRNIVVFNAPSSVKFQC